MKTKERKQNVRARLWLMYPPKLVKQPLIWAVGQKFKVVTSVGHALVTDEISVARVELLGESQEVNSAIRWIEKQGVNTEVLSIERNLIE